MKILTSDRVPSLCIFANFFIDNEERLQRMKDSFFSFRDAMPDEWRVNVRGRFRKQACEFLRKELGNELSLFHLESPKGWFYDSYSFMGDVKSDYIFFWIEDHICIVKPKLIRNLLEEIDKLGAHQLWYSFFYKTLEIFGNFPVIDEGELIRTVKIDRMSVKQMQNSNMFNSNLYVVSGISIMKRDFFISILCSKKPFLKRWPKYLPFDFEKKFKDWVEPVIIMAIPKQELFAAIDDDHGIPGYSLIARGLYPNRVSREKIKELEYRYCKLRFSSICRHIPTIFKRPLLYLYSFIRRAIYTLF